MSRNMLRDQFEMYEVFLRDYDIVQDVFTIMKNTAAMIKALECVDVEADSSVVYPQLGPKNMYDGDKITFFEIIIEKEEVRYDITIYSHTVFLDILNHKTNERSHSTRRIEQLDEIVDKIMDYDRDMKLAQTSKYMRFNDDGETILNLEYYPAQEISSIWCDYNTIIMVMQNGKR